MRRQACGVCAEAVGRVLHLAAWRAVSCTFQAVQMSSFLVSLRHPPNMNIRGSKSAPRLAQAHGRVANKQRGLEEAASDCCYLSILRRVFDMVAYFIAGTNEDDHDRRHSSASTAPNPCLDRNVAASRVQGCSAPTSVSPGT